MIADYDDSTGEWSLLASDKKKKLRRVSLSNGTATTVADLGYKFEGLARNSEGQLYANTKKRLYRILESGGDDDDDDEGYTVVEVGSMGLSKAESLEFAFGNAAPPVDVPGVDDTWTEFGVLFVFDDPSNQFGILNPATGQFKQYTVNGSPSSFSNEDAEGMIFVTTISDPLYGSIDGFD